MRIKERRMSVSETVFLSAAGLLNAKVTTGLILNLKAKVLVNF
jgi:hypothetical protein